MTVIRFFFLLFLNFGHCLQFFKNISQHNVITILTKIILLNGKNTNSGLKWCSQKLKCLLQIPFLTRFHHIKKLIKK